MRKLSAETNVPRWINTDAGRLAWLVDADWRRIAADALSVTERRELLDAAERKHDANREEKKPS